MDTVNISHASSVKKAGFVCSYVWDSSSLSFVAMTQPLIKTDTLIAAGTTDITKLGGSAVGATNAFYVQQGTGATFATAAKQLADGHNVNVSNIASTPVITGFATSANQGKFNGVTSGITTWKEVDGKPRVSTMPYLYDIAEGNVTEHTSFAKLGFNGDVGTSEEDIWGIGGTYVFPLAAQQMELVSTSVEDDILTAGAVAGTGVHKVKIGYLDNTYAALTEEVTLNGQTVVLTTATNILRVNSIRVSVVGTGNKAAGLITIRNKTDHTTVYRSIAAGLTRGREMVYTVPLGKTLYITSVTISSGYSTVGKNVRWTARVNLDDVNMTILPVGLMMPYFEVQTQDSTFYREFEMPLKVIATCDLKLSAISDSANSVCTAAVRGWTE
jgi:hypothetical protein